MTIATTADALQAIAQTVSGIAAGSAPTFANYTTLINSDGVLKDSLLPVVVTWPEQNQLKVLGDTEYEMFTDWQIRVYVARDHQTNTVAGAQAAMALAQAFMAKFLDKDAYTVTDGQFILTAGPPVVYVNRAAPISQLFSNIEARITYAGILYHGFVLALQTKEEGTL